MTFQDIINNFMGVLQDQNALLKVVLILLLLLFALFTLILARQISLLTKLLNQVTFSPIFKMIAYATVVLTLTLLLFVILV